MSCGIDLNTLGRLSIISPDPRELLCSGRCIRVSNHTPRVGRDFIKTGGKSIPIVSIHTPRVGRDYFLPTLQCLHFLFQSTRPAWGATKGENTFYLVFIVSIHTPRVGRDKKQKKVLTWWMGFNPHAPRGARPVDDKFFFSFKVSIHTPRVGRDFRQFFFSQNQFYVSIHTPRVGRDRIVNTWISQGIGFNPHAPRGARL
ncbi:MAG: hypothetical protein PWP62_823 [Eubacteriaceae bacterium]|nr:hypothetical protein [Eubacteriaceae bacterium]